MTPTTRFDNATVREISEACREALEPVAARYGLTLGRNKHRHSYHSDSMPVNLKMDVPVRAKDGSTVAPEKVEWDKWARVLGFEPSDFGREFVAGGRMFKISGCKPKGRKYQILGNGPQGGRYKFMASNVKAGLR
jgi:hypothetical protein